MLKQLDKPAVRLGRITDKTLVIGVDVGKYFDALVMMDYQGHVVKTLPRVNNTYDGYQQMMQQIAQVKWSSGCNHLLAGMEATAHYWRKPAVWLQAQGVEVVFVKSTSVKHQRVLDYSSRAKNDVKDAALIASLVREGKYCDTVVKWGLYQGLRGLVKHRERVCRDLSATLNRVVAWMDDYFPELRSYFSKTQAKSLIALLRSYPLPKQVCQVSQARLSALLASASRQRRPAEKKATQIQQAGATSIGLADLTGAAQVHIRLLLDDLEHHQGQKKVLEKQIEVLLEKTGYGTYLLSVPGVGPISAAVFLGELGDPKHFHNAKEIISYSGLDPFEDTSGLSAMFSRCHLSKQGRHLLRTTLYRMAVSAVQHNPRLKSYYKRKLKGNRTARPMKKKSALCAVAIKLVKLLYALLRDQQTYNSRLYRRQRKSA